MWVSVRGDVGPKLVEHRVLRGRQLHRFPVQRHPAQGVVDAQSYDRVGSRRLVLEGFQPLPERAALMLADSSVGEKGLTR